MKVLFIVLVFILSMQLIAQDTKTYGGIYFNNYKANSPNKVTDFAVKGDKTALLNNNKVHYKYSSNGWHYIRTTSESLVDLSANNKITQIYFTPSFPKALNDTMRLVQNIDSVHAGYAPLIDSFTGKGVIIGYVDTGIDWQHGDFKNADGSTRVLRYWDHSLGYDAQRTPVKYGYGQVWSNNDIDNNICTSTDNHAHGTTVTGAGSGNAGENGRYLGAAPNTDIIIVETNFNLANWTLTIADAIDYVFTVADSMGKPAIVNTSIGDYLGSHDGTDPASHIIDSLLNDQSGRIVVAALGNSGNWGKYHVHGDVDIDTSFTWFEVNPSSGFGVPAVYFDFWADTADFNNVDFAIGANMQNTNFDFRGRTQFFNIQTMLNQTTIDSVMNLSNKLTPVEIYAEEVNGVYHLEVLLSEPDSSSYLYSFMTYGDGDYDIWSGTVMGLSNIKSIGLPSAIDMPDIVHYHTPDTLMTLVSSWNCLESVVSVANFAGQLDYIDMNGNNYSFGHIPGNLAATSSKGPTRANYQKPDVSATGDGLVSAVPLFLANNGSNALGEGGMHVRNGGTSMACPVISGIAALYLEKCSNATFEDYRDALHANAFTDNFTGVTPNYAYGYGKVNAFKLLNSTNFDVTIIGDTLICDTPVEFSTVENNFVTYNWFNDETTSSIIMNTTDTVFVQVGDVKGCKANSDTIRVVKGTLPISPSINILGGGLVSTPADSYQWYFEGNPILNADEQFYNPDTSGNFTVEVFSPEGCSYLSDPISIDLSSLIELKKNEFIVFPNPFINNFQIIKNDYYQVQLVINDVHGKLIYEYIDIDSTDLFISVDLGHVPSGLYFVTLNYNDSYKSFKLIKQ